MHWIGKIRTVYFLAAFLYCAGLARGKDGAFWVWNRGEPLSPDEEASLLSGDFTALYWQQYLLDGSRGEWKPQAAYPLPPAPAGIRIVPVVRLVSGETAPFSQEALASLQRELANTGTGEIQIDYDCPDRLLGDYARLLAAIRSPGRPVSATALAGWSGNVAWRVLQASVDELIPMFYDLEPDPLGESPPLLLASDFQMQLDEWNQCRCRWRAGLPTFARLTLYDAKGKSLGNIRVWHWDDVCFDTALATLGSTEFGVTRFKVLRLTRIGDTLIHPGQMLAARWPDLRELRAAIAAVRQSNAAGYILFRLPDSTDPSGWSLAQLCHMDASPAVSLKREPDSQSLTLTDDSDADIAPRLSGTAEMDRGYALEIDAPAPVFRDAVEGDFWRVNAHSNPDSHPEPVPVPLATRLTFWFSHLPAHQSLQTGFIQLAPGIDFSRLRYRVLNIPGSDSWRSVE
jgi:hypothetical protein